MLHGAQRGRFELSFAVPAQCADRLLAGEADVGIVPSVELERLKLEILPGAGIASRGAIRSILLISKVPPARIQTLAADASSRTSVVLAEIILAERYGLRPRRIGLPPHLPTMLEAADAAVIIGDPALRLDTGALPYQVFDLGAEWHELTGAPMVFAVWAARPQHATPEVAAAFLDSCRFGRAHLEEIIQQEAAPRGISQALAREYLTRLVVNELGEEDYRGLRLFLEHARRLRAEGERAG